MTQFIRRDQAEHMFSLSLSLCKELLEGICDVIDKTEDVQMLTYLNHILVEAGYGIDTLTAAADKLQFYEVKINA